MRSKDTSSYSNVCWVLGILALCAASVALAEEAAKSAVIAGYQFTSFDVPGASSTFPHHINNVGVAVGGYFDSVGNEHGFVRAKDGTITSIDAPLAVGTTDPEGINDAGDIVGWYLDANGTPHGFLRDHKGAISSIDVTFPGAQGTVAFAINPQGTITGWYGDMNLNDQVFLRSPDGKFTAVNPPGAFGAFSQSINNSGVTAGIRTTSRRLDHYL